MKLALFLSCKWRIWLLGGFGAAVFLVLSASCFTHYYFFVFSGNIKTIVSEETMRFKTVSQHWKFHHHLYLPLRAHMRRSLTISWCWHRINTRRQHISPICFIHLWGKRTVFQTREINPVFMSAAKPLIGWVLSCCKVAVPRMAFTDFPASRPSAVCKASISLSCCVHFSS